MSKERSEEPMDQHILDVVGENTPKTVQELVTLVQLKYPLAEEEILERILTLQDQGKLTLKDYQTSIEPRFSRYLLSGKANWYWTITAIAAATTALVFILPEDAYPFTYARHLLGAIFVLFLPGYSLIKALFPLRELDNIERIALSIGTSIALVPITGLLLNYTPWGIRPTPVTLSLLILTMIFATTALIREHHAKLEETP